jgi:hypothetical protein
MRIKRHLPEVAYWGVWLVVGAIAYSAVGPLALLLAPLGWWLEIEAKKRGYLGWGGYKRCPRCAEDVRTQADVCRYCGHEFAEDVAAC